MYRGAKPPLCTYITDAANNALYDAAGCWLLAAAAAAAGTVVAAGAVAAAVAAVAAAVVADLFNRIIIVFGVKITFFASKSRLFCVKITFFT